MHAHASERRATLSRLLTSLSSLAYPPKGVYAGGAVSPRSIGVRNAFLCSPCRPRDHRGAVQELVEPSDSPLSTALHHPPRGGSGQEPVDRKLISRAPGGLHPALRFSLSTDLLRPCGRNDASR